MMKFRTRLLSFAAVAAAALALAPAAHAAQANLTLSPGASGCVDSSGTNEVDSFGFVTSPSGAVATFRLRNVTTGTLVAGPVVGQQATLNVPGTGISNLYRICANNNVSGQTIKVTLIINGF